MSGRPSAAADKAAKWLLAEMAEGREPTTAQVAARSGLSHDQAARIRARAGLAAQPKGWPRRQPVPTETGE